MRERNFTMDKVRMVAALVVMMGHLLHTKESTKGFLIGSQFEKIFSSGSFAVIVFFGLSGIALRIQTEKYGNHLKWFIGRMIRLMPVYWVTFLLPLAGCHLLGVKILYPSSGLIVAAVGLQALLNSLAVPPINAPLWSLSVEIYLSASLLIIGRFNRVYGTYLLIFLISINLFNFENGIIRALPIFYFGYLITENRNRFKLPPIVNLLFLIIPLCVLLIEPNLVQGTFSNLFNFSINFVLASFIILWTLNSQNSTPTLFSRLSQRSYSLYAVHGPLLAFTDIVFFSKNHSLSLPQIVLALFIVAICTEVLFQTIEKPSINYSRKYLARKTL